MIYLLLFSVLMLLIYAYYFTGKDILSPWLISCVMYIISIGVFAINASTWNVILSAETVLTILGALIFFGLGELFVRGTYGKKNRESKVLAPPILPNDGKPIIISTHQIIFITFIMAIILIWDFKETYRLSLIGGNPGGYDLMLKYARSASETNSINFILTLLLSLCTSMSYFIIFAVFYNIIYFGKNAKWRTYLIPLVIFLCQLVLTTGREVFIQLFSTSIIISYVLINKKNNWRIKKNKLVFNGLITILIFFGIFFALGFLTNKSILGFSTTISLYVGGSIQGLNQYLQNQITNPTYFGGNTMFGIYSSLSQVGFNVPKLYSPLEFFFIGNHGVNIYTPLRRYIQDFSYVGMLLIQFLLGVIYSSALIYLRRQRKVGVFVIIFSMFFYPIVESAIEERFFMLVTSLNAAYKACGVIFFYWLFLTLRTNKNDRYRKRIGLFGFHECKNKVGDQIVEIPQ